MNATLQDVIALMIVLAAALYIVRRLTGWPRLGPKPGPPVVMGDRFKKGLKAAKRKKGR